MSIVKTVTQEELDKATRFVDRFPKSYTCPNCGERHRMSIYEQADFDEIGKRITMCGRCGWLTYWERKGLRNER